METEPGGRGRGPPTTRRPDDPGERLRATFVSFRIQVTLDLLTEN